MMAGIGIYAIDLVLSRRFLSTMPEGSQSYFSWAMRLCDFPQGIFVLALQAATLPSLAKLVAERRLDEVAKTYAYGMRLALFVAIPATALFVALAHPLVAMLFRARRVRRDVVGTRPRERWWRRGSASGPSPRFASSCRCFTRSATRALRSSSPGSILWRSSASLFGSGGPFGHVGVSVAITVSSAVQMALLWAGLGSSSFAAPRRDRGFGGAYHRCSLAAARSGFWQRSSSGTWYKAPSMVRLLPGLVGALVFGVVFLAAARCSEAPSSRHLAPSDSKAGGAMNPKWDDRRCRFHRGGRSARADDPSGARRGRFRRALQRR